MDNILMVVGVGAWALAAGSMGYMAAIAGTRDFDTTMKKIFISVMTVSCAITGGFVGYVLGRFAGFQCLMHEIGTATAGAGLVVLLGGTKKAIVGGAIGGAIIGGVHGATRR